MAILHRNKPGPIGLDIGHDSIKMLQLARVGASLSAVASARWQFPDNAAEDGAIRRRLTVEAVSELLEQGGFRGRRVVTCLNWEQLVIKQMRLPHMSDTETRSALLWEANERFGFKLESDQFQYLVAGEIPQGAEVREEIIGMGVRRDVVEDHLAMLEEVGLSPVAIDAEPVCLFRSFERFLRRRNDRSSVTVLVDLGVDGTRVVIARGRQIAFIKGISIGGRYLNRAVAERLNLSLDETAQLRQRLMLGEEGTPSAPGAGEGQSDSSPLATPQVVQALRDALRPTVEELSQEISLCLRYYAVTFRGAKPELATLVGGEVYDARLRELLGECLNIRCAVGQPLHGVDLSQVDLGANRRGMLSEWAVAAGLALRHLNADSPAQERADELDRLSA